VPAEEEGEVSPAIELGDDSVCFIFGFLGRGGRFLFGLSGGVAFGSAEFGLEVSGLLTSTGGFRFLADFLGLGFGLWSLLGKGVVVANGVEEEGEDIIGGFTVESEFVGLRSP